MKITHLQFLALQEVMHQYRIGIRCGCSIFSNPLRAWMPSRGAWRVIECRDCGAAWESSPGASPR